MTPSRSDDGARGTRLETAVTVSALILSLGFVGFGLFAYGFWERGGPGPGFFPTVFGLAGALCAGASLLQRPGSAEPLYAKSLLPALATVLAVLLAYLTGMIAAMLALTFVWIRLVERRSWIETLATCAALFVLIYFVFSAWLGVRFPGGALGLFG